MTTYMKVTHHDHSSYRQVCCEQSPYIYMTVLRPDHFWLSPPVVGQSLLLARRPRPAARNRLWTRARPRQRAAAAAAAAAAVVAVAARSSGAYDAARSSG